MQFKRVRYNLYINQFKKNKNGYDITLLYFSTSDLKKLEVELEREKGNKYLFFIVETLSIKVNYEYLFRYN